MPSAQLALGLQLRDQGISLVSQNNAAWRQATRRIAARIAEQEGQVAADQLHELCGPPTHQNAYGGVLRSPHFLLVGYRLSQHPSAHARRIGVYQLSKRGREELLDG
ncbi:hypothetical protein LCGC14_1258480 [marine sediment metagenome]|uniref:Uncharacterized protein n=1 Tax=marine sediment metagenome TaxID=412755 RepID=A0A0F9LMR9_9ZZZZ